jgi:tetratricopeptide (TPR) repeat protein
VYQPSTVVQTVQPPVVANDFSTAAETDFRAGRYAKAANNWQHALVDDPENGGLLLLLSQALFAIGEYDPAAGNLQLAMRLLPEDQWGTVVEHYRELYPNVGNYTSQLRSLESARTASPSDPALRFLLGYHYGYLGYPSQAVKELDAGIELQPQDVGMIVVRNRFATKLGMPAVPLPEPSEDPSADVPVAPHDSSPAPGP